MLAYHPPPLIVAVNGNIIGIGGAVHPGMVSALGKGEQLGYQHETTLLDAQLGADALLIARQVETKYPELAALLSDQAISVSAGLNGVGVVAKKGEVIP